MLGWCERAAEVGEDTVGGLVEAREIGPSVGVESHQVVAVMVMGDPRPHRPPEPLGGVRVRVVGRGVDQANLVGVCVEPGSEPLGATTGVDPEVVPQDESDAAAFLGALDQVVQLEADRGAVAMPTDAVREPTGAPVGRPKPDQLAILPGRAHPPLAPASLARPGAGKGRMQVQIDLILDVEIGVRQQAQKIVDVRGDFGLQVGLDQPMPVERGCDGALHRHSRNGSAFGRGGGG